MFDPRDIDERVLFARWTTDFVREEAKRVRADSAEAQVYASQVRGHAVALRAQARITLANATSTRNWRACARRAD